MINRILKFDELDSTQDEAKRNLHSYDEGTVIVAIKQTLGKGKPGNLWHSPLGGLYFSIILKPKVEINDMPFITKIAAKVVIFVLSLYNLPARMKLPNDVLIGEKKISGILAEKIKNTVIVGVGVNLNVSNFLEGLNATSTFLLAQKEININEFLQRFLKKFNEEYSNFIKFGV